jgi:hypothetical protein
VSFRPLRTIGVVVLVATAFLVPSGPVAARSSTTVMVTDTSAVNTDPRKGARAACPVDAPHVVNVEGRIEGGGGAVALTALSPDEDGTGGTARARARDGSAPAWSVTVRAWCSSAPAPQRRAVTRAVTAPTDAARTLAPALTADVTCPLAQRVLSTGYETTGDTAPSLVEPLAGLRTVSVSAVAPRSGTATVTAIALCVPDPGSATPSVVVVGFGDGATNYVATAGPCPKGMRLTGSGGGIVPGYDVYTTLSYVNAAADTVTVYVWDLYCCAYGTLVSAYGICS